MAYIGNDPSNRFVAPKAASVFSGDGSTTAFTLDHAVGSDEDILVSVDGVIQEPSVAYAVSNGTTLTFTAAPSSNSGNNIFVYYLFRTVATVDHPSTSSLQATDGTFSGVLKTDDTTEATSTTDGSLQTDGGLSVAKDIVAGDDIHLKSDSAQISFGADSEVTLDHTADTGLTLQGSGLNTNFSLLAFHTTDGTVPDLRLGKSSSNTVGTFAETANGEALGQIRFTGQDSNNAARSGGAIAVEQTASSTGSTVPSAMTFSTTGSEAMRILSNGDVAINSTTTSTSGFSAAQVKVATDSGRNSITVESNRENSVAYGVHADGSSGTRYAIYILNGAGGEVGKISYTSSAVTYATTSDYRLKENISYDFDATTRLKQLKPCRFNFTMDEDNNVVDGFLAHEVSSIVPEAILGEKDATKKDGSVEPQSIDQAKLVPLLVKTIQELEARITALESK
jgi:hypothetical protein